MSEPQRVPGYESALAALVKAVESRMEAGWLPDAECDQALADAKQALLGHDYAARKDAIERNEREAYAVRDRLRDTKPIVTGHAFRQEHQAESLYCGFLVPRNGGGDLCGRTREQHCE